MKLSNKILIGFFGFIFVYMAAAFTEIRFRGTLNGVDENSGIVETANISGVNYLVLPDLDESITIIGSDRTSIEVRSLEGNLLQNLKFEVIGDTLSLLTLDLKEDQRLDISIYVQNTFRGMTVDGSGVSVKELDQNKLFVWQNGGWIRFQEGNNLKDLTVKTTNDADLFYSGNQLDTLSANIDNSNVMIYTPTKHVKGAMTNNGYLLLNDADEIKFKKDASSRLNWN